ncbi:sigma-54-dependent transcriptional regulator [Mesoaciditoga lauensis]|uniref:sigma-54-dependent transcriptional regulator n=1 Tax=Mesoaciditoga lauensis TaxID=1495039 RepID=UPI00056B8C52|nr:sigma-54 dependent transcriptional regulator [Mesoaciditoga lauensis]
MAEILVVEDDASLNRLICKALEMEGHNVKGVRSISDARKAFESFCYDLTILDLMLPDGNGLDIIDELVKKSEVIVISAHGDINVAVRAVQLGAFNFIPKPFELASLTTEVERALESRALKRENMSLRLPMNLVGESAVIRKLRDMITTVASKNVTVLIQGESGTGKEVVARSIWQLSDRANGPFVAVNCGAIPEELFESELFGYEKGAFTGAMKSKAGKVELADTGILFLDEIGELPKSVQVKLLRVLETSEVERLGGTKSKKVNVRIISATNRNLEKSVKDGEFREDLYYRINVVKIEVPPLRERKEDIPMLVEHFSKLFSKQLNVEFKVFNQKAMDILKRYDFPGNVRELQNVVRSALVFSKEKEIRPEDLPIQLRGELNETEEYVKIPIGSSLEEAEKMIVKSTLKKYGGNKTKTAKVLGIGLSTLHLKLNQWGMKSEEKS